MKNKITFTLIALVLIGLVIIFGKIFSIQKADALAPAQVTICHATGSANNPYVTIHTSVNGTNGHFLNNGTPKSGHEGDLLLQGTVSCPSPSPTPTASPTASPTSTPKPSRTPRPSHTPRPCFEHHPFNPNDNDWDDCPVVTPSPTPTSTPIPSETPSPTPEATNPPVVTSNDPGGGDGKQADLVCSEIKFAPTGNVFYRVDPMTIHIGWTTVDPFVTDYKVEYGLIKGMPLWNTIVHGNSTDLGFLPLNHVLWAHVAGTYNGCVGPYGEWFDP